MRSSVARVASNKRQSLVRIQPRVPILTDKIYSTFLKCLDFVGLFINQWYNQINMIFRDKWGYPIETIKGKPIINFIRKIILFNLKQTLRLRNTEKTPKVVVDVDRSADALTPSPKPELVIPSNVNIEWWVEEELKAIDELSKERILALEKPGDMGQFHFGVGMSIRNHYGLWGKNALTDYFKNVLGVYHADDMSGILMEALWYKIHNKSYDPSVKIEKYRKHWEKAGCNMKGEKL